MPGRILRTYFVNILSSDRGVLYVGVTSDLAGRLAQHQQGLVEGFTSRHNVHRLVYFEQTADVRSAIEREKQIKAWRREKKLALVRQTNPRFEDLSRDILP
jgi:putative endonuclease